MKRIRMVQSHEVAGATVFIAASGYEARATFASRVVQPAGQRIVLGFAEAGGHQRIANDRFFASARFEPVVVTGDDALTPRRVLKSFVGESSIDSVAIDFSSMTRSWMWSLIAECWSLFESGRLHRMLLCYAPAAFAPPSELLPPPRTIGPVIGVAPRVHVLSESIALIVGLGYEMERALGLVEYVDPAEARFFYADPGSAAEYLTSMRTANATLFKRVGLETLVPYPLDDWTSTVAILEGVFGYYRQAHRVLCVPMGPKPFAAIACVLALEMGDVALWRVSSTGDSVELPREPRGDLLCAEIVGSESAPSAHMGAAFG